MHVFLDCIVSSANLSKAYVLLFFWFLACCNDVALKTRSLRQSARASSKELVQLKVSAEHNVSWTNSVDLMKSVIVQDGTKCQQ